MKNSYHTCNTNGQYSAVEVKDRQIVGRYLVDNLEEAEALAEALNRQLEECSGDDTLEHCAHGFTPRDVEES